MDELWEVVQNGAMPPRQYLPLHPEAKLSAEQISQLAIGLQATANN